MRKFTNANKSNRPKDNNSSMVQWIYPRTMHGTI